MTHLTHRLLICLMCTSTGWARTVITRSRIALCLVAGHLLAQGDYVGVSRHGLSISCIHVVALDDRGVVIGIRPTKDLKRDSESPQSGGELREMRQR